MNRKFTLILLLICCNICFAHESRKFSYLVVQFDSWKDHNREDTAYFSSKGESGVSPEMDKLTTYNSRSKKGYTSTFFFDKKESTQSLYNYFRSINEAMLFLGEHGWELVSVNNKISSEAGVHQRLFDSEVPYTKMNNEPVFYFKKPLGN